jgi:Protein of unknown function (DUF1822)
MCTDSEPWRQLCQPIQPQPGEIWEIKRNPQIPIEFAMTEYIELYTDVARRYLAGDYPQKYVMIITEPEPISSLSAEEIIDVMVLSETNFVSNIDLLIPSAISGIGLDLLAETWLVKSMLVCNLLQPTGKRLSRQIYDILLQVHDNFYGLCNQLPMQLEIEKLGIKIIPPNAIENQSINSFHDRETAWSDILTIPVAVYRNYLRSLELAENILDEVTRLSQDLEKIELSENQFLETVSSSRQTRIVLSRWLENIVDIGWEVVAQIPQFSTATRSLNHHYEICSIDEILTLVQQLSLEYQENERRRIAKRLGKIAIGNNDAIQALVNLLRTTQDDETLWTAVESLWQIDPGHAVAGVRRVKLIDLGMQIAGEGVALAVALVSKMNGHVGVLLQVYPTGRETYLPPELQLMLLDGSGNTLRIVKARLADIYVQLKFSGEIGEQFSVRVALGEAEITENFII